MWILGACVLFGVLMALRGEMRSVVLRAAIAGFAFAFLGIGLWQFRKQPSYPAEPPRQP